MIVLRLLFMVAVAGGSFLLLSWGGDHLVRFLYGVFHEKGSPSVGLFVSIATAIAIFLYPVVTQNWRRREFVVRYRWAELELVKIGKIEHEEILEYHAAYHWDVYAVASISALLIVVSVLFTTARPFSSWDYEQQVIVDVSLFLLGVASIALAFVDLVHTNTLSPLVPAEKRFGMIHTIIMIGSASIILEITAVSTLLALISNWLSITVSGIALLLCIYFTERRTIPLEQLQEHLALTVEEIDIVRRA